MDCQMFPQSTPPRGTAVFRRKPRVSPRRIKAAAPTSRRRSQAATTASRAATSSRAKTLAATTTAMGGATRRLPAQPKQCAKCPPNRFLAQCAKCPAGWYSPDTTTWFKPCVQKTISGGNLCAEPWKRYVGRGSDTVTTRNDRCTEYGGTCTNGYLKDTVQRRKENDCGKCFAGLDVAGGKCVADPSTAGWARPGECKDCATTTLQAGALTYVHQSAGPCVFVKAGQPRTCQPALKDTGNKAFKCAFAYTMCDPPLTTATTPKPATTTPQKTCVQQYPQGVCRDTGAYTCTGGFAAGLCPGASTNACCKSGQHKLVTVPTPKPRPPPTPKPPPPPTPRPSPTPPPTKTRQSPMLATTPPPAPGPSEPVCGVDDTRNASSFQTRTGMEDAGWKFSSTVAYMFYTDKARKYSKYCWEPRTSYCGFIPREGVGWIELKLSLRGHASGIATIAFGNGAGSAAHYSCLPDQAVSCTCLVCPVAPHAKFCVLYY